MKKTYIDSKKNKIPVDSNIKNSTKKDLLSENQFLKEYLKKQIGLSKKQILEIIEKKDILLPISIFRNKLSTLEVIVKYLHENKKLSFSEISSLLKRDDRTIWHAYQRSLKKKILLKILDSSIKIPVSIFSDRNYSPLEILVSHLKDSHQLKFTEIAALLDLSPKTVWTVYRRYTEKDASK